MSLNDLPGDAKGLALPRMTYMAIVMAAIDRRPVEMCGLLYIDPTNRSLWRGGWRFADMDNHAEDPTREFVVDPAHQLDMKQRYIIGGLVHSHPNGEARPSDYDRASYIEERWWYLVVGMATGQPRVGCYLKLNGELRKRPLLIT